MTAACLDSLKFSPKQALCRYYTHPFEMTFSTNFYRTVLELVILVRNYLLQYCWKSKQSFKFLVSWLLLVFIILGVVNYLVVLSWLV